MDRCIYCFKEISQDICPFCGKKQSSYKHSEYKLTPGTIIADRYIIGAVIGEGGFGITYLAYDKKLEARCAVKEYFPHELSVRNSAVANTISFADNGGEYSAGLVRFRNEAEKLSKFYSIKSIVNVRDYIEENNTGYIIMNYVEGISLKEYLDTHNGKIEAGQFFSMIEPIIHALSNVQKEGIIHRDISPENIMVTEENRLVLIDFGSAREYEDNKSLSIILKHGYAPPEQYISTGKQGPWTDVYSVCATIYRAITGKAPDDSIDLMESGSKTQKPSKLGAKLSEKRETALMKGLELNYKERIQSCEELYSKFYIEDDGKIGTSSNKAFAAGAASVAVLAVACAAVFFAVQQKNDGESIAVPAESVSLEAESTTITTTESITVTTTEAITETEVTVDENILASGNTENGEWVLTRDGVLTVDVSGAVGLSSGGWTEYSDKITEVVLGDDVTEIGTRSFKDYTNLKTVRFNDKLEKIGDWSFMGCTALESADIPESVTLIERSAFEASGIASLSINGAAEIKSKAFSNCANLSQISLGNAVWSSKNNYLFENCKALESIVIPEGITEITAYQFKGCESLKNLSLPDTVNTIGSSAFSNCISLKEISLPKHMKTIEHNAFLNCTELCSVDMPEEIDEMMLSAFNGCSKYCDIYLPESVGKLDLFRSEYIPDTVRIYFPDNFSYEEFSKHGSINTIYIGSGKNPAMAILAEEMYDVRFTDDSYTGNYISGNVFYVNKLYEGKDEPFRESSTRGTNSYSLFKEHTKAFLTFLHSGFDYIVFSDTLPFNKDNNYYLSIDFDRFDGIKGIYIPSHIEPVELLNTEKEYAEIIQFPDKPDVMVYTTKSDSTYLENYVNTCAGCTFQYVSSYEEMIEITKEG